MKKIKTRLQLTTTTVRVLEGNELTSVNGGGFGSSVNPTACAAGAYRVGGAGSSVNPTACAAGANRTGSSVNPTACTAAGY